MQVPRVRMSCLACCWFLHYTAVSDFALHTYCCRVLYISSIIFFVRLMEFWQCDPAQNSEHHEKFSKKIIIFCIIIEWSSQAPHHRRVISLVWPYDHTFYNNILRGNGCWRQRLKFHDLMSRGEQYLETVSHWCWTHTTRPCTALYCTVQPDGESRGQ